MPLLDVEHNPWSAAPQAAPAQLGIADVEHNPWTPTAPAAAPLDKYQTAAQETITGLRAKGIPLPGATRQFLQGATLNTADEILAGLTTPFEMIKRGTFNPVEGYNYAKAQQDALLEEARKQSGAAGTAAEIGGGVFGGAGLAKGGLTALGRLAPEAGLLKRAGASALDAAGYGAVSGVAEGNTLAERGQNALTGAGVGALTGAALPVATSAIRGVAAPIVSNIAARYNPARAAQGQVARAIQESGMTPQQVAQGVTQAAQARSPEFTVADVLGSPGQRMLSTVARAPGQGRTDVVNFLEGRQAGQGQRVANTLAEGFQTPETAAQTQAALEAQRAADATVGYGIARSGAGAVNVTPVIQAIDQKLSPAGVAGNLPADSIQGVLQRARGLLTDNKSQLSRFDEVLRAKKELDNMIENAKPTLQRELIPIRNALDNQLSVSSPSYAAARNQFRRQSQAIEQVAVGKQAATRGRTENTIPAYQALTPPQQAAFRAGYVDPLIERVQGQAATANRALPFSSDAFQAEAAAMAPQAQQMLGRLGRENVMFGTRQQAIGGSATAQNLSDAAAFGIAPNLVSDILHGNWLSAGRTLLNAAGNVATGNTAPVRQEVGRLLLLRGGNVTPPELQRILSEAVLRVQQRQMATRALTSGALGGGTIGTGLIGR